MGKLTSTQRNLLESRRDSDENISRILAKTLIGRAGEGDCEVISPHKIISDILCSPDFIEHDKEKTYAPQVAERIDRGVVASVITGLKPRSVLETGTSNGLSSTIFTYPLIHINHGYLFSIDLPHRTDWSEVKVTSLADSGSIVPIPWRKRHINIIEDAKTALPRILPKLKPRVFIHDSLHTVTHMLFEYSIARAFMPPKSLLVSDDILWNDAFLGFCEITGSEFFVSGSNPNYGFAIMDMAEDDLGVWGSHELIDYLEAL
jgi:hypothetical protein